MKTLYFFTKDLLQKNKDASGSAVMRSVQICKNIQKRFKFVQCECTLDYKNKKNSIFLFVKDNFDCNYSILKKVKENNNIIIFDILDFYDSTTKDIPDLIKNHYLDYIDILIVNNYWMRHKYYTLNKPIYVIPHHFDPRLPETSDNCEQLQFLYVGELGETEKNCLYVKELKAKYNLKHYESFQEYKKNHKKNYCFISIRKEGTYEFNNRPLTKLAHAAGAESNIIITKDKSVMDFIDPSYPYLLKDSTYKSVVSMIEFVKKTFKKDIWKKALQMMKELKIRLHVNQVVSNDYMKIIHYLGPPLPVKKKYKICFVTSYFGNEEYFELSNQFIKVEYADYYCFTNLGKISKQVWDIIKIDKSFLPDLHNVKKSRYFKFLVWKYMMDKMKKEYDFIFYCDHYLHPNYDVNWMKICHRLDQSELGFLQYEHKRFKYGIEKDLECIAINNTEDEESLTKAKSYLQAINSSISLRSPQYFENTVFGMQTNMKKVKNFTRLFWQHYGKNYPSYRDQPLWNYLLLFKEIYPYVDNDVRYYFNGYKTIWRNKENY